MMVLVGLLATLPPLLGGGSWSLWVYNALVLLVIACPCALVLSTPVSVVAGLTAAQLVPVSSSKVALRWRPRRGCAPSPSTRPAR